MSTRIIIIGAAQGEVARLIAQLNDAQPRWDLAGYVDDDPKKQGTSLLGHRVLGTLAELESPALAGAALALAVGSPGARQKIVARLGARAGQLVSLVHPRVDTREVRLGRGVIALEGAVISPGAVIGDHALLSFHAVVAHEVVVGPYCNVSPGAVLNGRCRLGAAVAVGSGAIVLPDVEVGDGAILGAGAVVMANVERGATAAGNPARVFKRGAP